jgi:opacity protein-like surface antigen
VEIYRPGSAYYLTPGLRYHYNLTNRLYLYGAAGAGVAFRRQSISVLTRDPSLPGGLRSLGVASDWNASPGFNAGAGLGFRLSRFFSLRAEYRSFRSTAIRGFRDARETPGIYAGWAMHR